MADWIQGLHPALQATIRVLLFVVPILLIVPALIWWERRLLSWMQDRIGPNRVGPFGLLQPIADGVKLFFKEDITPAGVDRKIYFIAPALALFPAFAIGGTLPWGPDYGLYGLLTPIANVDIGILYILAISSLGAYGVVVSGYASNNKYSLMGGLRASAQLISYELGMGVSIAAIVMAAGSLRLTDIVNEQAKALWGFVPWLQNWFIFTPFGFLAAVVFIICVIAETNRAPFDLPEAENELIAGYHTEYSSMKFAVFFMGEYAVMFLFGGVFAALFLGGYNLLPLNYTAIGESVPALKGLMGALEGINYWGAPIWFLLKCALGITFFIWLRATLPRLRYDQLMSLGWKTLLPVAVANFIVVAIWIMCTRLYGPAGGFAAGGAAILLLVVLYLNWMNANKKNFPALSSREIELVSGQVPERRGIKMVDG